MLEQEIVSHIGDIVIVSSANDPLLPDQIKLQMFSHFIICKKRIQLRASVSQMSIHSYSALKYPDTRFSCDMIQITNCKWMPVQAVLLKENTQTHLASNQRINVSLWILEIKGWCCDKRVGLIWDYDYNIYCDKLLCYFLSYSCMTIVRLSDCCLGGSRCVLGWHRKELGERRCTLIGHFMVPPQLSLVISDVERGLELPSFHEL